MVYLSFSTISQNTWEVSTPVKSAKPVATVKRRSGECRLAAHRALNRAELSAISVFMEGQEAA